MNVSMGGQATSLERRISGYLQVLRKHMSGGFGVPAVRVAHHRRLTEVFTKHTQREVRGARMLEIGCGQRAEQTALFAADGAIVTGVDMEVPTYRMTPAVFRQTIRENGVERAAKSLLRHLLFDGRYLRSLQREYGRPLDFRSLDIRIMNASTLDFPDGHFDFIFSDMAFEHIQDVPGAVAEINRVLKKDGVCWTSIHLFTSLSGGHNLEWLEPSAQRSRRAEPWDHLLDHRYPANCYLNRLRLGEFRKLFGAGMTIVEELSEQEAGDRYLTAEHEGRLAQKGYDRQELLTRFCAFVTRKR